MTPENVVLNGSDLDKAIDAAMLKATNVCNKPTAEDAEGGCSRSA